jgi:hypothetical protein
VENKGLLLTRKIGQNSVVVNGQVEIAPLNITYEFNHYGKNYNLVPFNFNKSFNNTIPHDDPKLVWVLQKDDGSNSGIYLRLMEKDKINDPKQPAVVPILLYREPTSEELNDNSPKGHDFPVYNGRKVETFVKYLKTNKSVTQPLAFDMPFEFTDTNLKFVIAYENPIGLYRISMRFIAEPTVKIYRRELLDQSYNLL